MDTAVEDLTLVGCFGRKPVLGQLDCTCELPVFLAYVPLSAFKFLWKIPACFAVQRKIMFFCSRLSQGVRTTRSLSGVEERVGWDGMEGGVGVTVGIKAREA